MPKASFVNENSLSNAASTLECLVEAGENLFDAFESQGITLPHGCLAGSCGACRIEILEGESLLQEANERERQTIESIIKFNKTVLEGKEEITKYRLSCRTKLKEKIQEDEINKIIVFKKF